MNTWIAKFNPDSTLIAPPACVAPGVDPAIAAAAMGWPDSTWRVITDAELAALQAPTTEEQYLSDRAVVYDTYERPYDGASGGILNFIRMMHAAALMEVPQDAAKLDKLNSQYQVELANMRAEYDTIDEKYGV